MAAETFPSPEPKPPELTGLARIWADIVAFGMHETVLRYASHGLLLVVLALAIWGQRLNFGFVESLAAKASLQTAGTLVPQATATPAFEDGVVELEALPAPGPTMEPLLEVSTNGLISRLADPHTLIPTRGRTEVITYTVQSGDTLFGIADRFGLKPETVLWGNYFTLKDDPHLLIPGQVLNILPVNGTYHYVSEGNTLEKLAAFYGVTPQDILDWPSNSLDPNNPVLTPNTYLVVPGGHRELQSWVVPTIKRSDRTTKANNFGQCAGGYSGAVGSGFFIYPTDNHSLSGYDYTAIHHGLDFRAKLGAPLYAVDNGVIVYAGPNDYGYGNLVVIDHGNGWQSVYGHVSQWNVVCGQSVFQGNVIGLAGSTGRSSGPHLHFELRYEGSYVNPWTVLP